MNDADKIELMTWLTGKGYKLVSMSDGAVGPMNTVQVVNGNVVQTIQTSFVIAKETMFIKQ